MTRPRDPTAAERQRLYRQRRRFGLRCVTVELPVELDDDALASALVERGHAEADDVERVGLTRSLGEFLQDLFEGDA